MMNLAVKNMTPEKIFEIAKAKSTSGWTILMAASESNNVQVVEWLLKNNADPNVQMDTTAWTAMHAASKNGNVEILKMLLDAGGNPELQAEHRDYGFDLKVVDVAIASDKFQEIDDLINQYGERMN